MYEPELKERAIEMALSGNFPAPESPLPVSLEIESRRLQKALTKIKKDIELLKKATVYFAAHRK